MAPPSDGFLVFGAGGHGKVVADLVRSLGHRVVGFADSDPEKRGRVVEPGGGRVIATDDEVRARGLPQGVDAMVVAIGDNAARLRCLDALADVPSPALVHRTATVSPSAVLGPGTVVFARAVIHAAAVVGRGAIVNTGAIVEHDCVLGDGAHVSPGAVLAGGVRVGERGWIGAGAVVIPGVTVGAGAMVGAGAVVVRDVPDGATVVGNPARTLIR